MNDEINRLGCLRFAGETCQKLNDFFFADTVPSDEHSADSKGSRPVAGRRHIVKHHKLPENILEALWEQPCCANTKLIPGKLSLCTGMLLMIQNNATTEMCITKGQEAIMHGWESSLGPQDKPVLETLFIELIDPPSSTTLDGLPQNVVVPLMKTSVATSCQQPDDTTVTVSRTQIEALPNFPMTDYASQGKTRPYNVVVRGTPGKPLQTPTITFDILQRPSMPFEVL